MDQIIKHNNQIEPNLVVLLSGKRKSGKDALCQKLVDHFKDETSSIDLQLITISAPLKQAYAQANKLDYEKLLDASSYKENYRKDMIVWSDKKRALDPGFFCRQAVENAKQKLKIKEKNS